MQNNSIEIVSEKALPTQEELDNLGPGCYVQVKSGEECFWAEITEVDGDNCIGSIHCELGSSSCKSSTKTLGETQFTKDQIVNLGCDNYCWC
ncbi:MAG: hypothetical protein OEX07_01300 [Gammaproteobacteria bacterium]|nr:hypothetical protein [Gammaproteobacteria bacterium]